MNGIIANETEKWKEFIDLSEDAAECLKSKDNQKDVQSHLVKSTREFDITFQSVQLNCFRFHYKVLLAENVCLALKTPFLPLLNAIFC